MLMQLLQVLGMSSGKDYLENISQSAPDSSNPEEMDEFIQDLVINLSGGGVGGTIKTGTKAAFDVSKNTLLKKFFEKYSGKPYPRKPITTRKGWTSEDLGGLSKITSNKNPSLFELGDIMTTKPYTTKSGIKQTLYEFQRLFKKYEKVNK